MKRTIARLAIAGLFTGALALPAASAVQASTPQCTGNPQTSFCGSEIDVGNNAYKVHNDDYAAGVHVVASPINDTNPGEDFDSRQTTNNSNERVFQAAPNGHDSGFCMTQVSGGTGVVLDACKNRPIQRWTAVGDPNTGSVQWVNDYTGMTLMAAGKYAQLKVVSKVTNVGGSYWNFDSRATEPQS